MKAVVIARSGGPEVLELREVSDPAVAPGEILIRVMAAALNRADLMQRQGNYPPPPGVPQDIPGLEYAGAVDSVGAGVTSWKPGDRVMGLLGGGGYAEKVVVPERMALAKSAYTSTARPSSTFELVTFIRI